MKNTGKPISLSMREPNDTQLRRGSRRTIIFTALIAFLGLFSGCASFPTPKTPEDTLLVVPFLLFDLRDSGGYPMNYSYRINLEHAETGQTFSFYLGSTDPGDFLYITGFPAGRYTIKNYETMGLMGKVTYQFRVEKNFVLENGKLSVLPLKFIVYNVNSDNPEYIGSVSFNYREINGKEEARIIKQLSEKEGFPLWRY